VLFVSYQTAPLSVNFDFAVEHLPSKNILSFAFNHGKDDAILQRLIEKKCHKIVVS